MKTWHSNSNALHKVMKSALGGTHNSHFAEVIFWLHEGSNLIFSQLLSINWGLFLKELWTIKQKVVYNLYARKNCLWNTSLLFHKLKILHSSFRFWKIMRINKGNIFYLISKHIKLHWNITFSCIQHEKIDF